MVSSSCRLQDAVCHVTKAPSVKANEVSDSNFDPELNAECKLFQKLLKVRLTVFSVTKMLTN